MSFPLTITASAMRNINRSAILEIIRKDSPISRTTIAKRLQVSLPTVMRSVDELVAEGFVVPHRGTEWSGGRRSSLLEFNADGHVVLGVDMGGTKIYGALSNLAGKVIDERYVPHHGTQDHGSFTALTSLIDSLMASPKLEGRSVRGIGVGVPGVTLHQEGVVKWAFTLNWDNFPLKAMLYEKYQCPITVDNDVNLATLGELWFGHGQNCRNMILIALGTGIGAGIIINGALYRGSTESSGEMGYMLPGVEFLGKNYVSFGALESVASGTGIADRARAMLIHYPDSNHFETLNSETVFEAARQNKEWAVKVVNETVDYLTVSIVNLTAALDPDLIVLGGGVSRSADVLLEPIRERMKGALPNPPHLMVSNLGLRAGVMGAISNVLDNISNFYVVQKLL